MYCNLLASLISVNSTKSIHKETVPICYILVVLPLTYITFGGVWIISMIIIKWCKCKVFTGKNNKQEMVNLLEDKEEEVVDSGDRDIHIQVSSTAILMYGCYVEVVFHFVAKAILFLCFFCFDIYPYILFHILKCFFIIL